VDCRRWTQRKKPVCASNKPCGTSVCCVKSGSLRGDATRRTGYWARSLEAHRLFRATNWAPHRVICCRGGTESRRCPDDIVLKLDPGMAFGTGLAPTTRMCCAVPRRLPSTRYPRDGLGLWVGDFGDRVSPPRCPRNPRRRSTPTGITVDATRINAEANGVLDRMKIIEGSLGKRQHPRALVELGICQMSPRRSD
jgi:hypothetical protein